MAVLLAVIVAVLAAKPKLFIYALPILAALWLTRRMAGDGKIVGGESFRR